MEINEDDLPTMRLEDLDVQVLDTLATSCCRTSSLSEEDDDDIEGMVEDYSVDDLNLDEEEPRDELEPDDEDSDDDSGDFEYDTEEED